MPAGTLRYGYVTSGLSEHRLEHALALLADAGYDGVALVLDHVHFDPFQPRLRARAERLGALLDGLRLACVVETTGRFVLDPRRENFPTLMSDGRQRRLELVRRAIDVAAALGAPVVSLRSGAARADVDPVSAWSLLLDGFERLLASAIRRGVRLALEPEAGMLVERVEDFEMLARRLGRPPQLGLTLDLGHCAAVEPDPVEDCIRRGARSLAHVHVKDMRRGQSEQLMLGDGELDVRAAARALTDIGYRGLVAAELPRHAGSAPDVVRTTIARLRAAERAEALA
jgi:sugar phosphate isomerase/epimerase